MKKRSFWDTDVRRPNLLAVIIKVSLILGLSTFIALFTTFLFLILINQFVK